MKDFPSGMHLVLDMMHEGVDLLAIGYKYNSKKVICFVCTAGCGNTMPGKPYEAKWMDANNNVMSRKVPRPQIASTYFQLCNTIDKHNHAWQFELHLKKHWVMSDGYFCIFTTILDMRVTNAWKAYKHHINARHSNKNIQSLHSPTSLHGIASTTHSHPPWLHLLQGTFLLSLAQMVQMVWRWHPPKRSMPMLMMLT